MANPQMHHNYYQYQDPNLLYQQQQHQQHQFANQHQQQPANPQQHQLWSAAFVEQPPGAELYAAQYANGTGGHQPEAISHHHQQQQFSTAELYSQSQPFAQDNQVQCNQMAESGHYLYQPSGGQISEQQQLERGSSSKSKAPTNAHRVQAFDGPPLERDGTANGSGTGNEPCLTELACKSASTTSSSSLSTIACDSLEANGRKNRRPKNNNRANNRKRAKNIPRVRNAANNKSNTSYNDYSDQEEEEEEEDDEEEDDDCNSNDSYENLTSRRLSRGQQQSNIAKANELVALDIEPNHRHVKSFHQSQQQQLNYAWLRDSSNRPPGDIYEQLNGADFDRSPGKQTTSNLRCANQQPPASLDTRSSNNISRSAAEGPLLQVDGGGKCAAYPKRSLPAILEPLPAGSPHLQQQQLNRHANYTGGYLADLDDDCKLSSSSSSGNKQQSATTNSEYNQLRILEMRKEKSRDAARSRRSKENHEFYELAKLLPLPAAITSQLDFLDKASIIRLTISFLKLRQFSVNGHPPWAPDFATLGSVNPYSNQSLSSYAAELSGYPDERPSSSTGTGSRPASTAGQAKLSFSYQQQQQQPQQTNQAAPNSTSKPNSAASLFEIHQGTHILQSLDGFAFAIGRDGRFLYISETVSMYLGLSQVEMTGSSVFDYTHQQDHEELARQLGIAHQLDSCSLPVLDQETSNNNNNSPAPASEYSAASNETSLDDYMVASSKSKRAKLQPQAQPSGVVHGRKGAGRSRNNNNNNPKVVGDQVKREQQQKSYSSDNKRTVALETSGQFAHQVDSSKDDCKLAEDGNRPTGAATGTREDPLVRQFCIRMKSTLTKRGCQHFKSSGYRVVHVVAHLRSYQSNDNGHLMDPLDEVAGGSSANCSGSSCSPAPQLKQAGGKRRGPKPAAQKLAENSCSSSPTKELAGGPKAELATGSDSGKQIGGASCAVKQQKIIGLVAVAIALPPPSINELRLESDTFVLRLGLDLRVTHIEPKITELLQYPVELIAGKSLYSLVHPSDLRQLQSCHRELLRKGQMMSGYYRLLARDGGYIWIQTCATLICNNTSQSLAANQSPQSMAPPIASQQLPGEHHTFHKLAGSGGVGYPNQSPQPAELVHGKQVAMSPAAASGCFPASTPSEPSFLDQDQCVIFVNYMITNIVDKGQIVDVCQGASFAPANAPLGFGAAGSNLLHNFNSPSSPACQSPCSTKSAYEAGVGPLSRENNNLQQPKKTIAPVNGVRRTKTKGAYEQQVSSLPSALPGDENRHNNNSLSLSSFNPQQRAAEMDPNQQHKQEMLGEGAAYEALLQHQPDVYGGYAQGAAKGQAGAGEPASWLQQSAGGYAGQHELVYQAASGGATSGASVMSGSVYKSAAAAASAYSQQVAAAAVYPAAAAAAALSGGYPAGATGNSWDTSSAAAAAAVANLAHQQQQQQQHQHQQPHQHHHQLHQAQPHQPLGYLEPQGACHGPASQQAAAAAAAAANHHHHHHHTSAAAANSYYGHYYGYYGNKFI